MQKMFRGAGVALITPFDNEANVDYEALVSHVDYVIEGGVDYLLALGTTSEVPTLSFDEQVAVVDAVIKEKLASGAIVGGCRWKFYFGSY
ncbi:MAG: dihydrodipicolinate synthase family protein [Bacteroidales bacterium]